MENQQKAKGTSIHLSPETMDTLTHMKHWGQSYDGLIRELLSELNKYKQQASDKQEIR
jgi:hypothetical protein